MKKYKKIIISSVLILLVIILGNRLISGSYSFSYSCGSDFVKSFNTAVSNKDFNFCSEYSGEIKWRNLLDPLYGNKVICKIKKTDGTPEDSIFKDGFVSDCSKNFIYSVDIGKDEINTCLNIENKSMKIYCIEKIIYTSKDCRYWEYMKDLAPDYYARGCDTNKYLY